MFPLGCGDLDLASSPVLSLNKTRDDAPGVDVPVCRGPVGVPGVSTGVLGMGTGVPGTNVVCGLGVAGAAMLWAIYNGFRKHGFTCEDPVGGDFYFVRRPHFARVHQHWHVFVQ